MSSRLDNFHRHFDDHSPVGGKFDHVVAPGYSYSLSEPKKSQHQHLPKHSQIPGLLRLNSVGEVSSARLSVPTDGQVYNNRVDTKPVLHNSKSAGIDISYRPDRFLTQSTMATAKSLTRSPNKFHIGEQLSSAPLFTKTHSHSFAQELQPPQLGEPYRFFGVKTPNSPFNLSRQSLVDQVFSVFSPARNIDYSKLFNSPSHQECPSLDTSFQASVHVDREHEGRAASFLSPVAAAYAASLQPSSSLTVPMSQQCHKKDSFSDITESFELPSTEVKCADPVENVEILKLVTSSPDTTTNVASDLSIIFDDSFVEDSSNDLSLNEHLSQCSLDKLSEKRSRDYYCPLKSDNDRNSSCDDSLHNSLKSVLEISSVLSAPRKSSKKGRPSSKKQKKRQREKRKLESSSPSVFPGLSSSPNNTSKVDKLHSSSCASTSVCQLEASDSSMSSLETSSSLLNNSIPRESSPVKAKSKSCSIASFFFMPTNLEQKDDGDSDWSVSEDESMFISPIKCAAFNVAANIDMIFKRKSIPSLKSVLHAEESGSDSETSTQSAKENRAQISTLCTSSDYSSDDTSVEFCVPKAAAYVPFDFGLNMGLSLDSIFSKKPSSCNKFVDVSTSSTNPDLSDSQESDSLAIRKINSEWNENYPTAGFRSCQTTSADVITSSSIKVHFAAGDKFKTVHIVGNEDRAGIWHQFAIDRERFQRRILDVEKVVSPILEASHRAKLLEHNQPRNDNAL